MKSAFLSRTSNSSPSRSNDQGKKPFFGVQAKLRIGNEGDKHEKEADNIADQIVTRPEQRFRGPLFFETATPPPFFSPPPRIQQKGEDQEIQKREEQETVQEKPLKDKITSLDSPPSDVQPSKNEGHVQTKCATCESLNEDKTTVQTKCKQCEEKEAVQKKSDGGDSGSDIESNLKSSKGSGSPMSAETTTEMSSAFGADMSGVRIHTDSNAVQMNKELGARAFTNGNDVYFNQGEYNPSSNDGKHLLAHELTHTIQQGHNQSSVQKKDDPCAPPKEKGSKTEAASQETAKPSKGCGTGKLPVKQPSKGQKKPDGEDKARDISSKEGSPVDDRQTHAPPADKDAPKDEKGIKEDVADKKEPAPIDPCAIREQKTGVASKGTDPAAGNKKEKATKKKGGDKKDEKEKKGDETDFLASIAQKGPSTLINPNGDGEEASPKVLAEKKKSKSATEVQLGEAQKTRASLNDLIMSPTVYRPSETNEKEAALMNASASSFLSSAVLQATGILDNGLLLAQGLRGSIQNHRQNLKSEISRKRKRTSVFFSTAKTKAKAKAKLAKAQLTAKHLAVLAQIEISSMVAQTVAAETYKTKQLELETINTTQLSALNKAYTTGYNKLIASGSKMGQAARTFGNEKAAEYKKNAEYKYEGFWDGYVTYNRQMAKVNAAKEVGKQYQEGMESQAKAQAEKMLCGQPKDLEIMGATFQEGSEALTCALLNSQESIEQYKKAAILQATYAYAELSKNIDNSLTATLNQLSEKKAVQLQLINDYGIRQAMAIEKDGELAIASALTGINKAANQLLDFLREYKNTIVRNTAPDPEDFMTAQGKIQVEFETASTKTNLAVEAAVTSSQIAIDDGASKSLKALDTLYKQGISAGRELQTSFNTSVDALLVAGIGAYDTILLNGVTSITAEQQNAVNVLTGVVIGISGLLTKIIASVDPKFTEADTMMQAGMQSTIDNELADKICAEAVQAAKDVNPWWVSALKVLLVIIVIVVVALVIGPAVIGAIGAAASALAGSLGAGVALAGTIGAWVGPIIGGAIVGALAGATIQVGNNLIDIATSDKELSWDNVKQGVVGAIIAGAIGGALGGLGGQFAQVILGRFGGALGPGMKFASDFGINAAFDLVGGVLGDLAAGNTITLEGILLGMAIGGAVQVSMGGLGALAKNSVNAPKVDADGAAVPRTGAKAKVEDFAAKIQDFQGRMMEGGQNFGSKAAFGKNAPTAEATSQGIVDANSRMQKGEFFPTKPADATASRPNSNTDPNATVRDVEGKTKGKNQDGEVHQGEHDGTHAGKDNPDVKKLETEQTATQKQVLEETRLKTGDEMTNLEISQELSLVMKSNRRKSTMEDYVEEVELPNGHIWRRKESGTWCRFSMSGFCLLGSHVSDPRIEAIIKNDMLKSKTIAERLLDPDFNGTPENINAIIKELETPEIKAMMAELEAEGFTILYRGQSVDSVKDGNGIISPVARGKEDGTKFGSTEEGIAHSEAFYKQLVQDNLSRDFGITLDISDIPHNVPKNVLDQIHADMAGQTAFYNDASIPRYAPPDPLDTRIAGTGIPHTRVPGIAANPIYAKTNGIIYIIKAPNDIITPVPKNTGLHQEQEFVIFNKVPDENIYGVIFPESFPPGLKPDDFTPNLVLALDE